MKRFWSFLMIAALGLLMFGCDNGVSNNDPHSFTQTPWEPTLLAAYPQEDGATKYQVLLPSIYEKDVLTEQWDGIGFQFLGEEKIWPLYAAETQNSYWYEFVTPNKNVFFNYGHFRRSGDTTIWANHSAGLNNGWYLGDFFGATFLNSTMSKVNPADLIKLTAVIDANDDRVSEGTTIRFSAKRSTGQSVPVSHIVQYTWSFGDDQSTAVGAEVEHIFANRGTYQVQLVVQDDLGHTNSAIVTIVVFKKAFPENTLPGGDNYIQVSVDRINMTATISCNLALTNGNKGKSFWWGTDNGFVTAWLFHDQNSIRSFKPWFINVDWGGVTLPFNGWQQYEFTWGAYYDYFDYQNNQIYGVNWDHVSPKCKFYRQTGPRPEDAHFSVLVTWDGIFPVR